VKGTVDVLEGNSTEKEAGEEFVNQILLGSLQWTTRGDEDGQEEVKGGSEDPRQEEHERMGGSGLKEPAN